MGHSSTLYVKSGPYFFALHIPKIDITPARI